MACWASGGALNCVQQTVTKASSPPTGRVLVAPGAQGQAPPPLGALLAVAPRKARLGFCCALPGPEALPAQRLAPSCLKEPSSLLPPDPAGRVQACRDCLEPVWALQVHLTPGSHSSATKHFRVQPQPACGWPCNCQRFAEVGVNRTAVVMHPVMT